MYDDDKEDDVGGNKSAPVSVTDDAGTAGSKGAGASASDKNIYSFMNEKAKSFAMADLFAHEDDGTDM